MWFCHERLHPKIIVWMFGTIDVYKITYMTYYIGNFTELHRTLFIKFWHALPGPCYHSKAISTTPLSHDMGQGQQIFLSKWRRQLGVDVGGMQCSRLKSSMPFKCDLALSKYTSLNNPSGHDPKLKMRTSLEVLNIICPPQEPTSVGHCHYKKWS